jgi:hypothetical protein
MRLFKLIRLRRAMGIIVRLKDMVNINPAWWNILGIVLVFLSAGHFSALVLYATIDSNNPNSWLHAFIIVQSWDGQEVHADELPVGSRCGASAACELK